MPNAMKTKAPKSDRAATLAKPLAPEDVRPGDYVAVLDVEYEYAAIAWHPDPGYGEVERVHRVRLRPTECEGPLRVVDACLPFVFVRPAKGKARTLDLRRVRLARLDRDYAERVRETSKAKKKSRRKKK